MGHSWIQRWARKLRLLPANKIRFGDVQSHAQSRKYSFYRPSQALLSLIAPGDLVKVWFEYDPKWWNRHSGERMWVRVVERSGDVLLGELDNTPFDITGLRLGDRISFGVENILSSKRGDPEGDFTEPFWKFCTTSQAVLDGAPVDFLARSKPLPRRPNAKGEDSGWSILAAGESGDSVFKSGQGRSVPIGHVLNRDDRWLHLIDEPPGQSFEWSEKKAEFVRLEPFDPDKD